MSQRNVEIVRRALDAGARRDLETLDALSSEELEFHPILAASEGRVFRGREGLRDYFAAIDEAFDDFRREIEDVIDVGGDRVVAIIRITARGTASGLVLEDQLAGLLYTLERGRIARVVSYPGASEALEAAGLTR